MERSLHRLLILPNLDTGGAEGVLLRLARQNCIEEIWVVGPCPDFPSLAPGLRFRSFSSKSVLRALPRLFWALRSSPPGLVISSHTHLSLALLSLRPWLPTSIRWLHREASFPSLNLLDEKHPSLFRWAMGHFYKRADGIIALGTSISKDLEDSFRVPPSRIHLLPNPARPPSPSLENPFPQERKGPYLLCLGRLHRVKGFHLVIEAFGAWKKDEPDLELWIVGEGPESIALQEQTSANPFSNSIHFLGAQAQPEPWLAHADLLLCTSSHEGNSNVLLEAISHGCPVQVLRHPGGSLDILKDAGLEHRWCHNLSQRQRKDGGEMDAAHRLLLQRSASAHQHRFNEITRKLAQHRVLHIITSLDNGGSERQLLRHLESLDEGSASVVCLLGRGLLSAEVEAKGIPLIHLDLKNRPFRGLLSFLAHLRQTRPRLVECWLVHSFALGLLSKWLSPSRHLTWKVRTHTLHEDLIGRSTSRLTHLMARFSGCTDAITYNSHRARREHEAHGFCFKKGQVVANRFPCFSAAEISALEKTPPPELQAILEQPGRRIGFVSRFHPQKDPTTFAKTASLLLKQHSDLRFICLGHGLDEDHPPWTQLIEKEGLEKNLSSFGPRDDILNWMVHFDLLVLSSKDESFPNVVGEAMALGVPCACTKVGDLESIIPDPKLLANTESPRELSEACLYGLDLRKREADLGLRLQQAIKSVAQ